MTMNISDPRRFLNALYHMGIRSYVSGSAEAMTLSRLSRMVESCTKCELSRTRSRTVFGEGSEKAELLFIGEAPGEE